MAATQRPLAMVASQEKSGPVEVKSSHAVMMSHPAALTKLILNAVRGRSS